MWVPPQNSCHSTCQPESRMATGVPSDGRHATFLRFEECFLPTFLAFTASHADRAALQHLAYREIRGSASDTASASERPETGPTHGSGGSVHCAYFPPVPRPRITQSIQLRRNWVRSAKPPADRSGRLSPKTRIPGRTDSSFSPPRPHSRSVHNHAQMQNRRRLPLPR